LGGDPIDPAGAEQRRRVDALGAERVEVQVEDLATFHSDTAWHDGEELPERVPPLEVAVLDGELVDQPALDLGTIPRRMRLEGDDVVEVIAAPADPPLEVALDAGAGIEDGTEPVALRQGVVGLPLVAEEGEPHGFLRGAGAGSPEDGQPREQEPGQTEGGRPEQTEADPASQPLQRVVLHRRAPEDGFRREAR